MNLTIGISGASGIIYGKKLLEFCSEKNFQTSLIITKNAKKIINHELKKDTSYLKKLATKTYENDNLSAPLASGSTKTNGMIIVPCSMKTIGSIANGITNNLMTRAADVTLKENKKLLLVPRETPIHSIHLKNMKKISETGAIILPASPGFYHKPKSINELTNFIVGKILDQFDIQHDLYKPWSEEKQKNDI